VEVGVAAPGTLGVGVGVGIGVGVGGGGSVRPGAVGFGGVGVPTGLDAGLGALVGVWSTGGSDGAALGDDGATEGASDGPATIGGVGFGVAEVSGDGLRSTVGGGVAGGSVGVGVGWTAVTVPLGTGSRLLPGEADGPGDPAIGGTVGSPGSGGTVGATEPMTTAISARTRFRLPRATTIRTRCAGVTSRERSSAPAGDVSVAGRSARSMVAPWPPPAARFQPPRRARWRGT
jgi:hypothetical protein